jgi:RIO kinase 1
VDLLAAKIYRPRDHRGFKNDAIYQEGRVITNGQVRRAVQKKSKFGREMQFGMWIDHEYEVLQALHKAGADTPKPYAHTQSALLMQYFGDHTKNASSLEGSELTPPQVRSAFDRLMWNIELLLGHNFIHGDLSSFNVMFWQQQVRIIDFPQAVDPRFNTNAHFLLTRDVERICQYFDRYGLNYDGRRIAERLWYKFRNAQL